MSRPRKEINAEQFEKLCGLQCTEDEICGWFDTTRKTLDRWCHDTYNEPFSTVFEKKRATGKISLRRAQWRLAEKNAAMAIFLGKNYLGQRETPSDGENTETLKRALDIIGSVSSAINREADGVPAELQSPVEH